MCKPQSPSILGEQIRGFHGRTKPLLITILFTSSLEPHLHQCPTIMAPSKAVTWSPMESEKISSLSMELLKCTRHPMPNQRRRHTSRWVSQVTHLSFFHCISEYLLQTTGWLNLLANVIDNFTHGLAVAGSYCISTKVRR